MLDQVLRGLKALSHTLESHASLAETISFLEREFSSALEIEALTIALGEREGSIASDHCTATFALVIDGRKMGTVSFRFARPPSEEQLTVAELFTAPLASAIAWRAQINELDRLHALARCDALTSLANRMSFDERLDAAWQRSSEENLPFTVALLDIDYFKVYNDVYGHLAGDECLRAVATSLAGSVRREGGFLARYGGEEFALIFETLEEEKAIIALSRVVNNFEQRPLEHSGSTLGRVSFSVGFASGTASSFGMIADLVREADRSLYRAKALGRNRICSKTYASAGPVVARQARTSSAPPTFEDETIGREADLTRVVAALRQSRMVTLVGPGGVGKSRLAGLAGNAAHHFSTRDAAYVDFGLLDQESDPAGALASALDITAEASDVHEALFEAVRDRDLFAIFDNITTDATSRVARLCDELLDASPLLVILATSRSSIGAVEERTVVVAELDESAAIQLLRVRSGSSDIETLTKLARRHGGSPENLEAVARGLAVAELPITSLEAVTAAAV